MGIIIGTVGISVSLYIMWQKNRIKYKQQAGAELCQAQEKLGLAEQALLSKKLFLYKKTLRSSYSNRTN